MRPEGVKTPGGAAVSTVAAAGAAEVAAAGAETGLAAGSEDWAAAVNAPKPRAANSRGSDEGREVMALANLWKLGTIKGSLQ
jgi:hypothetical protein